METDPDVQLMLRFGAGDKGAFRRLFDRHKGRVITYCHRFCGNRQVAEELAQETFLRVYKAGPGYKPTARFQTWLFKIAANVCLNEIRKPHYRQRLSPLAAPHPDGEGGAPADDPPDPGAGPEAQLADDERRRAVRAAMDRLPEEQRAALLLRVEEEFSYQEIGRQLQRSENHVKTLIFRGRQRLKQALAAYFGERP
jgi:RNA polymerase sigma-70 factor (ECF subfamily)